MSEQKDHRIENQRYQINKALHEIEQADTALTNKAYPLAEVHVKRALRFLRAQRVKRS